MARLTGLWWWIDRWRKSTAYIDMSLAEQGAYRNLLDEAWLRGGAIPEDENVLAKACGDPRLWRKVRPKVIARFYQSADGWRNQTLDAIIAETNRRADKQRRYRNGAGNDSGNGTGNEVVFLPVTPTDLSDPETDDSSGSTASKSRRTLGSRAREGNTPEIRAGRFCEWYEDTHQRLFGVGYMGTQKDYQKALELVAKFTDQDLRDGALVWFGMEDEFATDGTRSIPKFASRITGCLQAAKRRGIA